MADNGIIDQEALAELDAADPDDPLGLLIELVGLYAEDGRKHLRAVVTAVAEGDRHRLSRSAHALKGSSRMVGALRVSKLCQRIEAGRAASSQELDQLQHVFDEALAALRREIVRRGGVVPAS